MSKYQDEYELFSDVNEVCLCDEKYIKYIPYIYCISVITLFSCTIYLLL